MISLLLQDWLTLQGSSATGNITQTELAWLDTSAYLDLVVWVEVTELSGGTFHCAVQTSPTKDEALFMAMNDVTAVGPALATGVQVGVYLRDTALCPLSHWLRWQIMPPSSAWNITFRVWVAASQPGGYAEGVASAQGAYAPGPAWTAATGGAGAPGSSGAPWEAGSLLKGGNLSNQRYYGPKPLGAGGSESHLKRYSPPPLGADSGARMKGPRGVGPQHRNFEVAPPGSNFNRRLPPGTTVQKK